MSSAEQRVNVITDLRVADDIAVVGGKAANLGKLMRLGYPVPAGFVIGAPAYDAHVEGIRLASMLEERARELRSTDYREFGIAAKDIRDAIVEAPMPPWLASNIKVACDTLAATTSARSLAVRSSAGVEDSESNSWAGQFDSFLEVDPSDVCHYVQRCWASLFGARAMSYGRLQGFAQGGVPFGVVVQVMVLGSTSGVAFSVDPTEGDPQKLRIEAVEGTGERLVSGRDTPYALVVDKRDAIVLRRSFGSYINVDLFDATALRRLVALVTDIERDFGYPVDVEWTLGEGEVSILQARPISAVSATRQRAHGLGDLPDILDYELTFKVTGLGFMWADLLSRGFGYLHPLFTFKAGEFRQYFPRERMEFAAREGYRWLSRAGGFAEFRREFEAFHAAADTTLRAILREPLSSEAVAEFFRLLARYLEHYSHTDFQFTNLTYFYARDDPIVKQNLDELAVFKEIGRQWINNASINEDSLFAQLLNRINEEFGIDTTTLDAYKIGEVEALFEGGRVDPKTIAAREKAYAVYFESGAVRTVTGRTALAYVERVAEIEAAKARSAIVGQVANRGKDIRVEGVVRVINVDYGDIERMDTEIAEMAEGEILVSEFTAPELMEACRKAKAIVTDLGGMLSHAAIVSRELGIPCIVGTQHGSKALQNGDHVTVDLDSGLVEKRQ